MLVNTELFVLSLSLKDSELKRTVDESERIQRAYGHYFDLTIVNDNLDGAYRSLKGALERLSTDQQWVPVSWVFWVSYGSVVRDLRPSGLQTNVEHHNVEPVRFKKIKDKSLLKGHCEGLLYTPLRTSGHNSKQGTDYDASNLPRVGCHAKTTETSP